MIRNNEFGKQHCCLDSFRSNCVRIKVVGVINSVAFQKARICAEKLHQHLPFKFSLPQIVELFQMDWLDYIQKTKRKPGCKAWLLKKTVAVFVNNEFLGDDTDFLCYVSQDYVFSLPIRPEYYENLAMERCKKFMEKSKRKYVYFTVCVDDSIVGSFVFMLYFDLVPLTCQHFLNLCTGYDEITGCYKDIYYINKRLHRIVKNGWIQCGGFDFSEVDENAILDDAIIPDESYCIPHDRRGILSMANDGKHYNQSQFVVCLKSNPWMDHFYVAFGQLIDGAKTLKTIENIPTYHEEPTKKITILQCGEFIFGDEIKMETDSQIFLEPEPPCMEGEYIPLKETIFDYYSITPWLQNIVDKIDVRDTESLLITEKYLGGLYCLASDYASGMDMRVYEKVHLLEMAKYDSTTAKLHALLLNFHPSIMTEQEKMMIVSEISKIILAYIFLHEQNEFCLRHLSMNTHETIHKILEIAHDISLKAIKKAEGRSPISLECGSAKIAKIFEAKHANKILVSEGCMLLLEEILNKAIYCLIRTIEVQE